MFKGTVVNRAWPSLNIGSLEITPTIPLKKANSFKIKIYNFHTVVCDYINTMKTTFDFNFDLNQAVKQHEYTKTSKPREEVN